MPHNDGTLPPDFWGRPDVASALSRCDFPVILEAIRVKREWSQAGLAHAVGYSQSWVSRVVNGRQSLTLEQAREIAERLGIPLHLLRFAAHEARRAEPTRRRDFGKVVTVAAVSLAAPDPGGGDDSATAATLRSITGGQRRLDATSPARDLARAAIAHLEMSGRALARAERARSPATADIAAASSEAAGFTAWLHMDMGDTGSARSYYRAAVQRARQARHSLLAAYMLGSLAAFEIDAEDPDLGLALTAEAARYLGAAAHPTAQAWLACVRAVGHASRGDTEAMTEEVTLAERAVHHPDNEVPPWPWVFPFDSRKVAGARAQAAVRLRRPGEALRAFSESFGRVPPSSKPHALLLVEWASAYAAAGDVDRAFELANGALRAGVEYQSERIICKVRRFRRAYSGPQAQGVRVLDDRLAALTAMTAGQRPG